MFYCTHMVRETHALPVIGFDKRETYYFEFLSVDPTLLETKTLVWLPVVQFVSSVCVAMVVGGGCGGQIYCSMWNVSQSDRHAAALPGQEIKNLKINLSVFPTPFIHK